jgi:hypothetical protein
MFKLIQILCIAFALFAATTTARGKKKGRRIWLSDGTLLRLGIPDSESIMFTIKTFKDGNYRVGFQLENKTEDAFNLKIKDGKATLDHVITSNEGVSYTDNNLYSLVENESIEGLYYIRRIVEENGESLLDIPNKGKFTISYIFGVDKIDENSEPELYTFEFKDRQKRNLKDGLYYHGLFLYIAWGWLCFFVLITGRFMKYFFILHGFMHTRSLDFYV